MPRPLRILLLGPAPAGPHSQGGMATVMKFMADHPDPNIAVRVIPTYVDASWSRKLMVGVAGMAMATTLIFMRRVDVLHVNLSHGGSVIRKGLPLRAARLTNVPAVIHAHSYDFAGWFGRLPHWVQSVVKTLLPADRWLVLGAQPAAEYRRCLQLPDKLVSILYNPVSLPRRVTVHSDNESVGVVGLGRLGRRKGSYDLINAIGQLTDDVRSRMAVTLAGDGEVEEVRSAVELAGLAGTIKVRSWVSPAERDELLSAAQIFVLPTYHEGLPMALLEAMAFGLAPITTPVGVIPEVIEDRQQGLLVAPGDVQALAEALRIMVCEHDRRREIAAAARHRAEDFDISGWLGGLAALWTLLAAGRNRRPECLSKRHI